jgi:hypothetical protein
MLRSGLIYFGALETYDDEDQVVSSAPIIARQSRGNWRGVRIDDPRLKNASWIFVGAGPNQGEIWGVLDQGVEDKDDLQEDLLIAHSIDGGQTFALTSLHKPDASATFDSLCIGPDGHGRVTAYLPGEEDSIQRPGYYHYRTTDFGRSWAKPRYEPDAVTSAQSVGDDEQPQVPNRVRSTFFAHK